MARPGIDYDRVKRVAAELRAQGVTPSIQRVRGRLGTGSNSTIGRYLKLWLEELDQHPVVALPPAVPEPVMSALDILWKTALEQTEESYREFREQSASAVAEAEQAQQAAINEMNTAVKETEALRQSLESTQATVRQLQDSLLLERERRRTVETAVAKAEKQAADAVRTAEQIQTEAGTRISKLEELLDQLNKDTEKRLVESDRRLHREQQRNEITQAGLMKLIEQSQADQATERQQYQREKAAWQARESILQEQLKTLQGDLDTARLNASDAEQKLKALERELSQLRLNLHKEKLKNRPKVRRVRDLLDRNW